MEPGKQTKYRKYGVCERGKEMEPVKQRKIGNSGRGGQGRR